MLVVPSMKSILKNKGRQAVLADDGLVQAHLDVRLFEHAGFPEATDSLAYDGVQRLLAVSLLTLSITWWPVLHMQPKSTG